MNRYESFLNTLCLDHSYICLDGETFNHLLPLVQQLKGAAHLKTVSGEDSWEGIYIRTRTGSYFEILKERTDGVIGIAISPVRPHYVDASKITEAYPDLNWKKGTRVNRDGSPWFDWFSSVDYSNVVDTIFNPWVMKYYLSHRDDNLPVEPLSIDRIKRLELELGSDYVNLIKQESSWLPGKQKFENDRISLTLPDREGSSYEVAIRIVPGNVRFRFRSLLMDLAREEQLKTAELGSLKFEVSADEAVLRANL